MVISFLRLQNLSLQSIYCEQVVANFAKMVYYGAVLARERHLFYFEGNMITCSFFGHRDTPDTKEMREKVRKTVEYLIVENGVDTFLFGSRSTFDMLCHIVVTQLKQKYPYIIRAAYLCKHETVCLVGKGAQTQHSLKQLTGQDVYCGEYEEVKRCEKVDMAGRACYVERNQWMIDDSNFVIVHLDETKERKRVSGSELAYQYAKKKDRKISLV